MSWINIISQSKVKKILKQSFENNRIAHSYLFWGSDGIGKDALAIEFAKTLLCQENKFDACGKCYSCLHMEKLQHPAFKIICSTPTGDGNEKYFDELQEQVEIKSKNYYHKIEILKANFIRIDSIREIRSAAMQKIPGSKYRVFLVTNVDEMNVEASNAFLKILEEPNPSTIFLLTTSKKELLLPTIISRCQLIQCKILKDSEISNALVEKNKINLEEAKLISKISRGNFRRAQELLQSDVKNESAEVVNFLRSILVTKPLNMVEQIEQYTQKKDRSEVEKLLLLLQLWLRDSILLNEGIYEEIVNYDQQDSLERFILKFKNKNIPKTISVLDKSIELLQKNVYLPLVLFFVSVELRKIFIYE